MPTPPRTGALGAALLLATALAPLGRAQTDTASSADVPYDAARDIEGSLLATLFSGSSTLRFYGFVHIEASNDTARLDSPETPQIVLPDVGDNTEPEFTLHVESTRLGLTLDGPTLPELGDASLDGRIEIDFQEGGSESRPRLRMRRAFLRMQWERWSVLAGQEWDLISPLNPFVNQSTSLWNAGNLGDRRTQIRATYASDGALSAAVALAAAGAVENRTVAGGLTSGEASDRPMIQARLAYRTEAGATLGLWGHTSQERFDNGAGEEDFDSHSFGADLLVPFNDGATYLKAEYFVGENLDDVRGGVLQGVNDAGEAIASRGGWVELGQRFGERWTLAVGASKDDPDEDDLDASNRRDANEAVYAGLRYGAGDLTVALELVHHETEYTDTGSADALRSTLWLRYAF